MSELKIEGIEIPPNTAGRPAKWSKLAKKWSSMTAYWYG